MIQVYTGNGKGKTTAAVGQVIRALSQGKKICFIQLFKKSTFSGEQKILSKLKNLHLFSFYPKYPSKLSKQARKDCSRAMKFIKKILQKNKYDILVLDEFNNALHNGLIKCKELLEVLSKKPRKMEIIITGRSCPQKLINRADLVTEMRKIKHPYDKGIKARRGIEW